MDRVAPQSSVGCGSQFVRARILYVVYAAMFTRQLELLFRHKSIVFAATGSAFCWGERTSRRLTCCGLVSHPVRRGRRGRREHDRVGKPGDGCAHLSRPFSPESGASWSPGPARPGAWCRLTSTSSAARNSSGSPHSSRSASRCGRNRSRDCRTCDAFTHLTFTRPSENCTPPRE